MSDIEEGTESVKKRKRQMHPDDIIRNKKMKGEEHRKHRKDEMVAAKEIGPDCNCKRLRCFEHVEADLREHMFQLFYNLPNHDEQSAFLAGLIGVQPITRRRPRVMVANVGIDGELEDETWGLNPNAATFSYKIRNGDSEIPVCAQAFASIFAVSRAKIRGIQQQLMKTGSAPKDLRGLHGHHYKTTPEAVITLIEDHIKSLRKRRSHYSISQNPNRFYLHEDLSSVVQLHELFLERYQIQVSLGIYRKIFNEFNLGFSMPRTDTCSQCDKFQHRLALVKMQATGAGPSSRANNELELLSDIETEREVHLKEAEQFRELVRKFANKSKFRRISCISFDFMQNLPMPNLQSSPVFYSRQLWLYVFGIHNLANKNVQMYVYDESQGKKGANNVVSMLFEYVKKLPSNRPLYLICDSCPGQNKNQCMVRFAYILVHVLRMFPSITLLFPIRGHSYLRNDSDFSLIKKKTPAETPQQWIDHISKARKNPSPFQVTELKHTSFYDFNAALKTGNYFLKTPSPPMRIQSVRMLNINRQFPEVRVKYAYTGKWSKISVRDLQSCPDKTEVELASLYMQPLQLKAAKIKDLRNLFTHTHTEQAQLYYSRLLNEPAALVDDEEEWSVDEDD